MCRVYACFLLDHFNASVTYCSVIYIYLLLFISHKLISSRCQCPWIRGGRPSSSSQSGCLLWTKFKVQKRGFKYKMFKATGLENCNLNLEVIRIPACLKYRVSWPILRYNEPNRWWFPRVSSSSPLCHWTAFKRPSVL